MSDRYPWRNTSEDIAGSSPPQYETPGGAQEKADAALAEAKQYTDEKNVEFSDHVADTDIHVTLADKANWNSKAPGVHTHSVATPTTAGFESAEDKAKLDGIATGAQVNQPAFANINGIVAAVPEDGMTVEGGIGILVTSNPTTKKMVITATSEAAPGPHASTHVTGGTDVIPDAVAGGASGLMSGSDATFVRSTGETKIGAQAKADAAAAVSIPLTQKGAASGVATLDASIRLPAAQLPVSVVQATTADVTYYVNNSTGNDSNDGLSTSTPLKTRAAAIAKIPQTVNHNVTIIMMNGESGTLTLQGYSGKGKVTVKGQTTTVANYALNAIVLKNCSCSIDVENVAIFNASGTNLDVSGCADVFIGNVSITQSNTGAGVLANSSFVTVSSSVLSNQTYGIVANRSVIYSYNNTGSGNTIGLVADQAGTIGKGGTQPSGTTAELQQGGGVVR